MKKKICNVLECEEFISVRLDELAENNWSAFQIPNGNGKVVCYCPKHQKIMKEDMEIMLLKYNERKR